MDRRLQEAFGLWALNGKTHLDDDFNGPGSTDWYTAPLRRNLPHFLEKHGIKSMLDAPCGDASWMSQVEFPPGFDYLGAEIHPDMVERNNSIYSRNFVTLDITDDLLPDKELIFVRDCLFHLNDELKLKFFLNLLRTDFRFLLTSTHPRHPENEDLGTFGNFFKPVNFNLSPWFFPEPLDSIIDYDESDPRFGHHPYRTMALWSKEQVLRSILEHLMKRMSY